jgi:sugar/nucleoside kinase (ribokinase family)
VSAARLLVAGSVALDRLEGPFGEVQDELGGSAVYFALAASLVAPVELVAPVGRDAAATVEAAFRGRAVDLTRLTVLEAPTYRWQARQIEGRNQDLGSQDSIYDLWRPELTSGPYDWVFIGSMRPDRQVQAARQAATARLLAADAMRSYLVAAPAEARTLLDLCSWFFCNSEEFAVLSGDHGDPQVARARWGLEGLVIKAGPQGVAAYTADGRLSSPALLTRPVVDTTGAGDALAGGMLARWRQLGGKPEGLADALSWGVACASIAIEGIGVRALAAATPERLQSRVAELAALSPRAAGERPS